MYNGKAVIEILYTPQSITGLKRPPVYISFILLLLDSNGYKYKIIY